MEIFCCTWVLDFDCIGLTEIWLKDMKNIDIYNIPDYILLSNQRTKKEMEDLAYTFQIDCALRKEMI